MAVRHWPMAVETTLNSSNKNMWLWLAVLGGIAVGGGSLTALLAAQSITLGALIAGWVTVFAILGWLFWGMWLKREIRVVKVTGWYIATGLLAGALAVLLWTNGSFAGAICILGMWGMAVSFVLGLVVIRLLLRPGLPIFGVARTLIDEAIRAKVALIFIVGLLLLVPILPVVTSEQERLQYRVQAFLSWSLIATGVLLGLLTMFLACSTIAGEISSKRIFMTMTKPISRLEFLAGKWLGIVVLDALLLAVAGLTVFVFARMIQQQPTGPLDRVAVDEQVLTARMSVTPRPPAELDFQARFEQRLEQLQTEQPDRYPKDEPLSEKDRQAIQKSIIAQWQTIAPGQTSTYVFHGLDSARDYSSIIQLRFKVQAAGSTPDEMVTLGFRINNSRPETRRIADDSYYVYDLTSSAITPQGTMRLEVANLLPSVEEGGVSISFPPNEGLEVLYRTGTFEGNLARSLVITWVKLSFIAILGLAAGTFLSFPVAVLLTMLVYCTAGGSEFLAESLRFYAGYTDNAGVWEQMTGIFALMWQHLSSGQFYDLFKLIIRLVGECFVAITPSFGKYSTTVSLADGRMITWQLTFEALWRVGLVATGIVGLVGWAIFQKRELARVTV